MHNKHTNVQVSDVTTKVLNDTWRAIQANHPDVPDVFLVVKSTGRVRRGTVLGHYSYSEWAVDDTQAPEVMISGECFAGGAEQVLQTSSMRQPTGWPMHGRSRTAPGRTGITTSGSRPWQKRSVLNGRPWWTSSWVCSVGSHTRRTRPSATPLSGSLTRPSFSTRPG